MTIVQRNSTRKIIQQISKSDKRIKYFFNKINKGCAYSRNLGLQMYKGDYITYIDADDVGTYNYLEKLYDNIKKVNAEISICQYKKIMK